MLSHKYDMLSHNFETVSTNWGRDGVEIGQMTWDQVAGSTPSHAHVLWCL